MSRRLRLVAGLALAWAAVVALAPTAADAHGGAAELEVLAADEVAPGEVELRLAVRHEADGHPADGAIVDVVASGPGAALPAVRLDRTAETGVYAAALRLPGPGTWTLAVTSSFPPGVLDVTVDVGAGGEAAAGAGTPPPATSVTASTGTTSTTADALLPELEEPEAGGAEGGSDTTNLVVAAVSGVLGGALGLWASRRRSARRRAG